GRGSEPPEGPAGGGGAWVGAPRARRLAGAGPPRERRGGGGGRAPPQKVEDLAHARRAPDQPLELEIGRRPHRHPLILPDDADHGLTNLELGTRLHVDLPDARILEKGSVGRAQILDQDAVVAHLDLDVAARNRLVALDGQIIVERGTDPDRSVLERARAPGRGP